MTQARNAHEARLHQTAMTQKVLKPNGNYHHGEHQWGVIENITVGPPSTVDVYLDGTQNAADPAQLTLGIPYLSSYVPTVGDVVLLYRGDQRNRTNRVVLGKLYGSASPYPLPLGQIEPKTQRFISGPNALWGGAGSPMPGTGRNGDYYFRTDTAGVIGESVYANVKGEWFPIGTGNIGLTSTSQTYSVSGPLAVANGATNYLPPFFVPVNEGMQLTTVRTLLRAGSVTFNLLRNNNVVATGITASQIATSTTVNIPVADNDAFRLVLTSVSGADGLSASLYFAAVA